MRYPFTVFKSESDGHSYWVAKSSLLKGCVGQGDTQKEAMQELEENENVWLDTAKDMDIPIPAIPIFDNVEYSGKMTLRIAPHVHRKAAQLAKQEGISLNQYINDAIVSMNAQMAII